MSKILEKLYPSIALGAALALVVLIWYHGYRVQHADYWAPFFTFLHVLSGITWIGLLYYFNLVQTPMMPKIPAELKPGVSKYIAPEALFWFRWSALATIVTGLIVATLNGYVHQAFMLVAPETAPSAPACGSAPSWRSMCGSSSGRCKRKCSAS